MIPTKKVITTIGRKTQILISESNNSSAMMAMGCKRQLRTCFTPSILCICILHDLEHRRTWNYNNKYTHLKSLRYNILSGPLRYNILSGQTYNCKPWQLEKILVKTNC